MSRARPIATRSRRAVAMVGAIVTAAACGFPDVAYTSSALADGGATTSGATTSGADGDGRAGPGPDPASAPDEGADVGAAGAGGDARAIDPPSLSIDAAAEAGSGGGSSGVTGSSGGLRDSGGESASSSGASGASSGSASSGGSASSSGSSSGSSGGSGGGSGSSGSGSGSGGAMNCNCSSDHLYPANVSCGGVAVTALNLGLLCNQTSGFVGSDPGCGNPGTFITCSANLTSLVCSSKTSTVVQQCH